MKINVTKPKITRKKFNLKAKTCDDAADELNKTFPGHFEVEPHFDIKMNASDKSVKSVTISADGSIRVPDWPQAKSLGPKTLKEWKRFQARLEVHEEGHRLVLLESMAIVANEVQNWHDAKTENGELPTGDELNDLYKNEWFAKYYDPPQDKYDSDTKNGKTQDAWFEASRCD